MEWGRNWSKLKWRKKTFRYFLKTERICSSQAHHSMENCALCVQEKSLSTLQVFSFSFFVSFFSMKNLHFFVFSNEDSSPTTTAIDFMYLRQKTKSSHIFISFSFSTRSEPNGILICSTSIACRRLQRAAFKRPSLKIKLPKVPPKLIDLQLASSRPVPPINGIHAARHTSGI